MRSQGEADWVMSPHYASATAGVTIMRLTTRCRSRGSSSGSGTPCAFTSLIGLPRWSLTRSPFFVPLLRTYTTCLWTSSMYWAFVLKNWAFLSRDFTEVDPCP